MPLAHVDGGMIDVLKSMVYVILVLVLSLTGVVTFLVKWNMKQSKQIEELEESKKELSKVALVLKAEKEQEAKEKGLLIQKVQELQSAVKLHEKACGGGNQP